MKRALKTLRFITLALLAVFAVVVIMVACEASKKSDEVLGKDFARTSHELRTNSHELETVSLSYAEYLYTKASYEQVSETATEAALETFEEATWTEEQVNLDTMDVWTLGAYLYDIPEHDTTRALILITFEGYGAESPLSYYVACCCWVRATEGYWGYGDLYRAFGEADTWNYGEWLDSYGYAEYAVEVLRQCYLNPSYVRYCNGMTVPESYVYYEGGIYVW